MIKNPEVLESVQNSHVSSDGMLRDFCDGYYVRTHPVFQNTDNSLQIVGYYDDIEVANPLGSKASKHKLGMENYLYKTPRRYI